MNAEAACSIFVPALCPALSPQPLTLQKFDKSSMQKGESEDDLLSNSMGLDINVDSASASETLFVPSSPSTSPASPTTRRGQVSKSLSNTSHRSRIVQTASPRAVQPAQESVLGRLLASTRKIQDERLPDPKPQTKTASFDARKKTEELDLAVLNYVAGHPLDYKPGKVTRFAIYPYHLGPFMSEDPSSKSDSCKSTKQKLPLQHQAATHSESRYTGAERSPDFESDSGSELFVPEHKATNEAIQRPSPPLFPHLGQEGNVPQGYLPEEDQTTLGRSQPTDASTLADQARLRPPRRLIGTLRRLKNGEWEVTD